MTEHIFAPPPPAPPPAPPSDETLLTGKLVRGMFGNISDTCLWRWRADPAVGFPVPDLQLGHRNYWKAGTIRAWLKLKQEQNGGAYVPPTSQPSEKSKRTREVPAPPPARNEKANGRSRRQAAGTR